ncbi:MAG: hypothetical protein HZC05_01420 [Candidatus Magasanikbacteria bacterium]|nr:hypothetical protein [Candidatus Magasanikbacteria bacterium]
MQKFFPYFLVLLAIAARFLPHPANFTPIAAVALFSGVYLNKRLSILLPMAAMFLSDLFIGFYSAPIMISVYGSFAVSGFLGWWLGKHRGVVTTFGATLASSTIFFLVTNLAVWQFGTLYPFTSDGLLASYIAAIPFWRNMLLGDIFYVAVLFGCYEGVRYWMARKKIMPIRE